MCPLPVPNKTRKFGVGGIYPQSQGCGAGVCAPPPPLSPILFLLPLQMPYSLIAKLISNSCTPPPPPLPSTRLRETKKRAPVHRLLPCWAYVIGLGVNEKVQDTVEPMPNFFLGVDLFFFQAFFSSKFKPPPPHKGSAVFLNIELTHT